MKLVSSLPPTLLAAPSDTRVEVNSQHHGSCAKLTLSEPPICPQNWRYFLLVMLLTQEEASHLVVHLGALLWSLVT